MASEKNVYTRRVIDHFIECYSFDRDREKASESKSSSRSQSQAPSSGYSVIEHHITGVKRKRPTQSKVDRARNAILRWIITE